MSVATHALHYGTACFEGIRAYWNENHEQLYLLKMREHYERMANSCNVLRIQLKESIDDLCRITVELVRQHGYRQDGSMCARWPISRLHDRFSGT